MLEKAAQSVWGGERVSRWTRRRIGGSMWCFLRPVKTESAQRQKAALL